MHKSNTRILSALGVTGLAALALAGCGGGSSTSSSAASSPAYPQTTSTAASAPASAPAAPAASGGGVATISVAHNGQLGSILVAGPKGRTVYLFVADKGPSSTCSGACAEVWPPVTTSASPKAAAGASSADLGTITRSDGTKQVTYKGHPLYYYVGDPNGGQTSGQGINSFGAPWYVLSPSGSEVK
ncbi:MAG: COG4315 family predicted lipoprotein [Solirubrobacteraceae bacterium]